MGQIRSIVRGGILFMIISLLMSSCMVMRPGVTKSGKQLYESFFISLQTNQYFIKPMQFTSEDNIEMWLDFTFRDKSKSSDSATVNFTLQYDQIVKSIDSIIIDNGIQQSALNDICYIYTAKKKEKYNSRFTSRSTNPSSDKLFNSNEWNINVFFNDRAYKFTPSKRTAKSIDILDENLIELIRE